MFLDSYIIKATNTHPLDISSDISFTELIHHLTFPTLLWSSNVVINPLTHSLTHSLCATTRTSDIMSATYFGASDPVTGEILDGRWAHTAIPLMNKKFFKYEVIDTGTHSLPTHLPTLYLYFSSIILPYPYPYPLPYPTPINISYIALHCYRQNIFSYGRNGMAGSTTSAFKLPIRPVTIPMELQSCPIFDTIQQCQPNHQFSGFIRSRQKFLFRFQL